MVILEYLCAIFYISQQEVLLEQVKKFLSILSHNDIDGSVIIEEKKCYKRSHSF